MDAGQGEMARLVAARLRDSEAQRKAGVMPYQMLAACLSLSWKAPSEVKVALDEALEASLGHVPGLPGRVAVCIDASGSMHSPLTGQREGATTKIRCIDVAALYACAVARKNPSTLIVPFDDKCHDFQLVPGEGVFEASRRLAKVGGGGTDCSMPLDMLVSRASRGSGVDTVVFLSDNQSWMDTRLLCQMQSPVQWALEHQQRAEALRKLMAEVPEAAPAPENPESGGIWGPVLLALRRLGVFETEMGPFPTPAQAHRVNCQRLLDDNDEYYALQLKQLREGSTALGATAGGSASPEAVGPAYAAFLRLKEHCPAVRMVCIDLQPYASVQVPDRPDVLNLGGFSDHVFELVAEWTSGRVPAGRWEDAVAAVELPPAVKSA